MCSDGSRGGGAPPPPSGQIFLNFMQFSEENIKFYPGAPRSEGWRPPPPCENPGSATDVDIYARKFFRFYKLTRYESCIIIRHFFHKNHVKYVQKQK